MSTEIKLQAARETGTGLRKLMEVSAYVQHGVVISPGGGSALVVVNTTGTDMARDALVYISGVNTNGELEVDLADADVDDAAARYYLPAAILRRHCPAHADCGYRREIERANRAGGTTHAAGLHVPLQRWGRG